MSPPLMILLRDRRHVAVLLCLAAACALLIASGSLLESGLSGAGRPHRLDRADIVVGGSRSVTVPGSEHPESVALPGPARIHPDTVRTVTGFAVRHRLEVVADHTAAALAGPDLTAQAETHAWSAVRLGTAGLVAGGAPRAGQVVVERSWGLAPGDPFPMRTGAGLSTYRVSGVLGSAGTPPAVYLPDAQARELAGSDDPTLLGLLHANGPARDLRDPADDLRDQLDGLPVEVATGDDRAAVEAPAAAAARDDLVSIGASLIAVVLLVTVIVVAATTTSVLEARRREIMLLRTLVVTPRELVGLTQAVHLAVAGAAVLPGVPLGLLATRLSRSGLELAGIVPEGLGFGAGAATVLSAVALTAGISSLVAWATVRRLAGRPPAELARADDTGSYRTRPVVAVAGTLLVLVGVAGSLAPLAWDGMAGVAVGGAGGLLLVFGAAVAGRPVLSWAIRAGARVLGRRTGHWLAGALVRGSAARLATLGVPLVLGMSLALVQVSVPATLASSARSNAGRAYVAGAAVTSAAGVPAAGAGGVPMARQQVSAWVEVLGSPEDFAFSAVGFAGPVEDVLDVPVVEGSWDGSPLAPGTAVVSRFAAATLGLPAGGRLRFVLGDGTVTEARVRAVHDAGQGAADIVLPYGQLVAHRPAGGIGAGAADAVLYASPPAVAPGSRVVDVGDSLGTPDPGTAVLVSVLPLLALFCYIAISVAGALAQAMGARRREFRVLWQLGIDAATLRSAVLAEAVVLAAACVLVGTAVALIPLTAIAVGLSGRPLPGVPIWFHVLVSGAAGLLAIMATLLSGRWAVAHRDHV
ncbi:ABC transporter permease [Nonomuraea spiralis]|uniref:ABC transporter permease n=1 Tax=Nonomuraea spiralis TaxID=46182 RepID=A0ABV5IVZ9_9ACTN|nr:ABC transporter permease [Nonomuraea spiralis]GGS84681.1 hypothetical protein GCM10010176_030500 [Nonomuraea spiralis]